MVFKGAETTIWTFVQFTSKAHQNGFLTMGECFSINQDNYYPEYLSTLGLAVPVKLVNFIIT